jgi:hypothetical protein
VLCVSSVSCWFVLFFLFCYPCVASSDYNVYTASFLIKYARCAFAKKKFVHAWGFIWPVEISSSVVIRSRHNGSVSFVRLVGFVLCSNAEATRVFFFLLGAPSGF